MARLIIARIGQTLLLVLGVIVINFTLIQMAPGSFLDVMTADQQVTDPALIDHMRTLYGMDEPILVQLWKYIVSVMSLDFGYSYRQNAPVLAVILDALPATVLLMTTSIGLAAFFGVVVGTVAAMKVNTVWDNLLTGLAAFVYAAPSYWVGTMLTILLVAKLGWLPVGGMQSIPPPDNFFLRIVDLLEHLALPAFSLGLFYMATYLRVMRASMLEVAGQDFARTARAKGLNRVQVVFHHLLRNAILPVVTLLGLQLGTVLGGSVVIEAVFSWPGIGSLMLDSVMSRNYPVVLGVLVLSSLVVVVANIMVDLVHARLDPRIRSR